MLLVELDSTKSGQLWVNPAAVLMVGKHEGNPAHAHVFLTNGKDFTVKTSVADTTKAINTALKA